MSIVSLHNCKNFDSATFCIEPGKLNIKYAPNGTGKSSISEGIQCAIRGDQQLLETIKPFKYRNASDSPVFAYQGLDEYDSVEIFNDSYVNSVVFLPDSLFAQSFDVFVKTREYDETIQRIEQQLEDVRICLNKEQLTNLRDALGVLSTSICGNSGLTGKQQLRATAHAKRGLSKGNPRLGIPEKYLSFSNYIESDRLSEWSKWHAKGHGFLTEEDSACPFCGQDITNLVSIISDVHTDYASTTTDSFDKVSAGVMSAEKYLCSETNGKLEAIIRTSSPLTSIQEKYFTEIACQANTIVESLKKASELGSYFNLAKAGKNIAEAIADCAIDLNLLSHFDSSETKEVILEFNNALAKVQNEANVLFGIINKQKTKLAEALDGYETEINSFFSGAGYPYTVKIEVIGNGHCSVKLIHVSQYQVANASSCLSYGEKNALALVFFMYSVLSSNPDLIILDDPITSFDGHKRFAILHMLFLKDDESPNSLKNKTVVLLTHEYGVVFDIEHTLKSEFQPLAKTTLLHITNSIINETVIEKDDMKPIRFLYEDLARSSANSIVRLAYTRRLLELDDDKQLAWDLLSSLFHHRATPCHIDGSPLAEEEVAAASDQIKAITNEAINYSATLQQINDPSTMLALFNDCSCKYEKLQIARIALDGDGVDRVAKKFLDETLHVDNGYIFQLNPREFETVPDSIVERCEAILTQAASPTNRSR